LSPYTTLFRSSGFSIRSERFLFATFFTIGHWANRFCDCATFLPATVIVTLLPITFFDEVVQVVLIFGFSGPGGFITPPAAALPTEAISRQASAPARIREMRFMDSVLRD